MISFRILIKSLVFSLSRALVGSSRINNFGFFIRANKRLRRCFCPVERFFIRVFKFISRSSCKSKFVISSGSYFWFANKDNDLSASSILRSSSKSNSWRTLLI